MIPKTDGGSAFPRVESEICREHDNAPPYAVPMSVGGMSLRDYFAGQALTGAFRGGDTDIVDSTMARRCYEIADAMLNAREA